MLAQAESCHTLAVGWYTQLHRLFHFLIGIWISNEQWIPLDQGVWEAPVQQGTVHRQPEASRGQLKDTSTLHFATAWPQLFLLFFKACFCISLLESHKQVKPHIAPPCPGAPQTQSECLCTLSRCHWWGCPYHHPTAPLFLPILGNWLGFSVISATSWGWNWGLNWGQQHPDLLGCAQEAQLRCSIVWTLTSPPGTNSLPSPTSGRMSTHKKCDLTICLASFDNNINYFISELISSSCK